MHSEVTTRLPIVDADAPAEVHRRGPDDAARTEATYAKVIASGEPHYWRTNVMLPGREFVHYERVIVPLASDGETVDMLIGMFIFDRIEPAKGS